METSIEESYHVDDEPSNLIDLKLNEYSSGYVLYALGTSRELNLLCSNLSPEQDEQFSNFIAKKLTNCFLRVGEGNLCTLDFSIDEWSDIPSICYYAELVKPRPVAFNEDSEIECSDSALGLQFIICFLTSSTVDLEFFRCELQEFSEKLLGILSSDISLFDKVSVANYLGKWSYVALEYPCRCLSLLGLDISVLFYLASTKGSLKIEGGTDDVQSDIYRFLANCSISEMMALSTLQENLVEQTQHVAYLKLNPDRSHEISFGENDDYCKEWARFILDGEQSNPLFLKRVMENFKLMVRIRLVTVEITINKPGLGITVQSLNTFKRLLIDAVTDHYALYRAFLFLKNSKQGVVLLKHAKLLQEDVNCNKGINDVIEVLENFI